MITKTLIAAAAVATMALALPVSQAEAKTKINIDIDFGFGGGYYGGYHHHKNYNYISCKKGRNIVDWSGFNKVHAVDCSLPGYKYTAWKMGHKYLVKVTGHGKIYAVNKIF